MTQKLIQCRWIGGETGIRTLDTLASITVFETAPFSRSGISPEPQRKEIISENTSIGPTDSMSSILTCGIWSKVIL